MQVLRDAGLGVSLSPTGVADRADSRRRLLAATWDGCFLQQTRDAREADEFRGVAGAPCPGGATGMAVSVMPITRACVRDDRMPNPDLPSTW